MKNAAINFWRHMSKILISSQLDRELLLDMFVPASYREGDPMVLVFDGQDWKGLRLFELLEKIMKAGLTLLLVVVAMHAGKRLQEYGLAGIADCRGRGVRADQNARFVVEELLLWLEKEEGLRSVPERRFVVECSLGGLTAFDLFWKHPKHFAGLAALSGSFWWRGRDLDQGYTDQDRVAHRLIRMGEHRAGLRFWLQAGTRDETNDRNQNGIIDSIDDTLDLVTELIKKGYRQGVEVVYHQVKGGRHDLPTWKKAFSIALSWLIQSNLEATTQFEVEATTIYIGE